MTKKMKTSELTGAALDWAVAKCEGASPDTLESYIDGMREANDGNYSTDWSQGGPIIERERIQLGINMDGDWHATVWRGTLISERHAAAKSSPLIAAMRCYVASKLGDEVDIPEELK